MNTTNKWYLDSAVDEYYDFERELLAIPDEGSSSVDIRLTFNVETKTCCYIIAIRSNDPDSINDSIIWECAHYVPWSVGLTMLGDEVEVPDELLDCTHE